MTFYAILGGLLIACLIQPALLWWRQYRGRR